MHEALRSAMVAARSCEERRVDMEREPAENEYFGVERKNEKPKV